MKLFSRVRYCSGIAELASQSNYNPILYSSLPESLQRFEDITGNWSITGFELKLQRHLMKYILDYYVPCGILVTISWVRKLF